MIAKKTFSAVVVAVSLSFEVNGNEEQSEHAIGNVRNTPPSRELRPLMSLPITTIPPKHQEVSMLGDPPYFGSVFVDENVITDSHPNALQKVDMYDQTVDRFQLDFAHIYFG